MIKIEGEHFDFCFRENQWKCHEPLFIFHPMHGGLSVIEMDNYHPGWDVGWERAEQISTDRRNKSYDDQD